MGELANGVAEAIKRVNWEYAGAIFVTIIGFIGRFFFDPQVGRPRIGRIIIGLVIAVSGCTVTFYYCSGFWRYIIGFVTGLLCDRMITFTYNELWPMFTYEIKSTMRTWIRSRRKNNANKRTRK